MHQSGLFFVPTEAGWRGMYCARAGASGPAASAYLTAHYPDGEARLFAGGDLLALGPTPATCEGMGEGYLPAMQPDYPFEPWPDLREVVAERWGVIHQVGFCCLYDPGARRWQAWDAWCGEPLEP